MRMSVLDGFKSRRVRGWAKLHLVKVSTALPDGLACFRAVEEAGCEHIAFVVSGKLELLGHQAFNWVNTLIRNVKNSLSDNCHVIGS